MKRPEQLPLFTRTPDEKEFGLQQIAQMKSDLTEKLSDTSGIFNDRRYHQLGPGKGHHFEPAEGRENWCAVCGHHKSVTKHPPR